LNDEGDHIISIVNLDPTLAGLRGAGSYGKDTIADGVHPQDVVDVESCDTEAALFRHTAKARDLHRLAK
jgi:hypothetical protein